MTEPLHVNPWRVRAWGPGTVAFGAVKSRVLPLTRDLERFHGNNATIQPRGIPGTDLQWLQSENFLRPDPLPLEHPYAPQLGFFSLWPGSAEARLERLQAASVGLLGVGTLGSHVAFMLAAAGIGHLVLVDKDTVEIRNLNRQFYDTADFGRAKVEATAEKLRRLRPQIELDVLQRDMTSSNDVEDAVRGVDIIVRAMDTPILAGFMVDKAARRMGIPHVGGGFLENWAGAGPMTLPDGPCFRCLNAVPVVSVDEDRKVPSFVPLAFWLSAMVGGDVLRLLAGLGEPLLRDRILMVDWATGETRDQRLERQPGVCPVCGRDNGTAPAVNIETRAAPTTVSRSDPNDSNHRQPSERLERAPVAVAPDHRPHDDRSVAAPSRDQVRPTGGDRSDSRDAPGSSLGQEDAGALIGAAAGAVGLCAVMAGLALLSLPLPVRWGVILGGELLAAVLGVLVLRSAGLRNGYLWGVMWGFGITLVGAVQVVLNSPVVMARPVSGIAAILIAVPIEVLILSSAGLLAAWLTARALLTWRSTAAAAAPAAAGR